MKISADDYNELVSRLVTWGWSPIRLGEHPWAHARSKIEDTALGPYREAMVNDDGIRWSGIVTPVGFQIHEGRDGVRRNESAPQFFDGGALWHRLLKAQPVVMSRMFSIDDVPRVDHR
jgi:hypothetical protein